MSASLKLQSVRSQPDRSIPRKSAWKKAHRTMESPSSGIDRRSAAPKFMPSKQALSSTAPPSSTSARRPDRKAERVRSAARQVGAIQQTGVRSRRHAGWRSIGSAPDSTTISRVRPERSAPRRWASARKHAFSVMPERRAPSRFTRDRLACSIVAFSRLAPRRSTPWSEEPESWRLGEIDPGQACSIEVRSAEIGAGERGRTELRPREQRRGDGLRATPRR